MQALDTVASEEAKRERESKTHQWINTLPPLRRASWMKSLQEGKN